ncbi:YraN family protein [Taibaiella sp. KBW10]|uniref:YraN family protein n=1 Tax=Taibaiella sp. KBW10 TaxID=2153357 RepID=UPI000F5ACF25|nr:YraN family protein [Taibaiella sp. KBW10]RQO30918.1 YraN family protein [Taibaiella sp. KBW10]
MSHHISKGILGEKLAVAFLESKQHHIVQTNFRADRKEVDIISLKENILIFTEVKTRSNFAFGYPEAAVTKTKQAHIKAVAALFLQDHPEFTQIRFDVISIILAGTQAKEIHHIEDAFY